MRHDPAIVIVRKRATHRMTDSSSRCLSTHLQLGLNRFD
jgi:hypothetical protein